MGTCFEQLDLGHLNPGSTRRFANFSAPRTLQTDAPGRRFTQKNHSQWSFERPFFFKRSPLKNPPVSYESLTICAKALNNYSLVCLVNQKVCVSFIGEVSWTWCKSQEKKECRGTKCSTRQFDKVSALKGELRFNNVRYDVPYLVWEWLRD